MGESFLNPPSSSNPLATSLALTSLPFHHRTHVVEIHIWPVSSTSSKVSKSLRFCNSTCLAATHSCSLSFSWNKYQIHLRNLPPHIFILQINTFLQTWVIYDIEPEFVLTCGFPSRTSNFSINPLITTSVLNSVILLQCAIWPTCCISYLRNLNILLLLYNLT